MKIKFLVALSEASAPIVYMVHFYGKMMPAIAGKYIVDSLSALDSTPGRIFLGLGILANCSEFKFFFLELELRRHI